MDLGIKYLSYLDDLKLDINDYVIGASASMVAHRLLGTNDDIDILIKREALAKLIFEKKMFMKIKKLNTYWLYYSDKSGHIDANVDMSFSLDIPLSYWYNESVIINNHRYMSIPQLKLFYKTLYNITKMPKHKIRLDILNKVK